MSQGPQPGGRGQCSGAGGRGRGWGRSSPLGGALLAPLGQGFLGAVSHQRVHLETFGPLSLISFRTKEGEVCY